MNPLASLITPVYNAKLYLPRFLKGVIEQTYRPLEFFAVDDGSTDGSLELLQEMAPTLQAAGITFSLLHSPHAGPAGAINVALKQVNGDYLTWCDDDDLLLPGSIEERVTFLQNNPSLGFVRSNGLVFNGDTEQRICSIARPEEQATQFIFDQLLRQTTYCYAGCYLVRTNLLRACYPDMEIPVSMIGQNLQLLLPLASRGKCGFVPSVLHHYYPRSAGLSHAKRSFTQNLAHIDAFAALENAVLPYCQCDQEHYRRVIEQIRQEHIQMLRWSLILNVKGRLRRHESRDTDTTPSR